jgi:hypothetical protein
VNAKGHASDFGDEECANKTLRNVRSAWIKEQQVRVSKGAITEYQVNIMITLVIDDWVGSPSPLRPLVIDARALVTVASSLAFGATSGGPS